MVRAIAPDWCAVGAKHGVDPCRWPGIAQRAQIIDHAPASVPPRYTFRIFGLGSPQNKHQHPELSSWTTLVAASQEPNAQDHQACLLGWLGSAGLQSPMTGQLRQQRPRGSPKSEKQEQRGSNGAQETVRGPSNPVKQGQIEANTATHLIAQALQYARKTRRETYRKKEKKERGALIIASILPRT